MVTRINSIAEKYSMLNPWSNVYGLARSIMALGTLIVLLSNSDSVLFFNISSVLSSASDSLRKIGLFYLLGAEHLFTARVIAVIVLVLVISGWRPRVTGILHWWISYSFFSICPIIDGGDQIISILTMLLIPVCLTDPRKNHWSDASTTIANNRKKFTVLFVWSVFLIIRIQVALVYFHAGIAKLKVIEWVNGTATYYWFTHPVHGAADWLKPFVYSAMSNPYVVVSITWGAIIFEILLSACLFMRKTSFTCRIFLLLAVTFHLVIMIIFGLVSFFCAMTGAVILFLNPVESRISFMLFGKQFRGLRSRYFQDNSKSKVVKPWTIDSPTF